ncbi:MAG: hypothetical protein K6E14_11380 [Paludibacteraceae bacterium]|nr:hypothetical protein [Paludibacteraceae bacterium]
MIVGDPNPKIDYNEFFPFDQCLLNLSNIDEEMLIKAIEELEKRKKEYVASQNKAISRIIEELKRRKRDKSMTNR